MENEDELRYVKQVAEHLESEIGKLILATINGSLTLIENCGYEVDLANWLDVSFEINGTTPTKRFLITVETNHGRASLRAPVTADVEEAKRHLLATFTENHSGLIMEGMGPITQHEFTFTVPTDTPIGACVEMLRGADTIKASSLDNGKARAIFRTSNYGRSLLVDIGGLALKYSNDMFDSITTQQRITMIEYYSPEATVELPVTLTRGELERNRWLLKMFTSDTATRFNSKGKT